jgi:hypothetical protein
MQDTEQAAKDWLVHLQQLVTAKADNILKLTAKADAAPYISSWQPSEEEPKRGSGPTSLRVSSWEECQTLKIFACLRFHTTMT